MTAGRDTFRVYGADVETDNDGHSAWVVQWAISNGHFEQTGRTLDGFRDRLLALMKESADTYVYFHNLKFDLSYIKYVLADLRDNYGCTLEITMREKNPIAIKIVPGDPKLRAVNIRDSLKKYPNSSLAQMAKVVNMKKLDGFDFFPGWSASVDFNLGSNWDYVRMDARIVAIAMQQLHDLGNNRATVSSDAWNHAKRMIDRRAWEVYFPSLDNELDSALRRGYIGGINISEHRGVCTGEITHADVTSMYPTVMAYDPLPIGAPTYSTVAPREGQLYVVHLMVRLSLKEGWIPWFISKTVLGLDPEAKLGEPVIRTAGYIELTLTSVDLANLKRSYDVDIMPGCEPEYFIFKSATGILYPYVDKFVQEKAAAEKGTLKYMRAKLMLNSCYGRFALNPVGQATELVADGDDLNWSREPEITEEHDAYLPYGMFVTSHAHTRLLDYVEAAGPENVIHCDTDSVIHYGGRVNGVKYGRELGEWDIEARPVRLWEGGFKRYCEQLTLEPSKSKDYKLAAAGVPPRMKIELLDNPELILSDSVLGNEEYKVRTPWLRNEIAASGQDPDRLNTMKLMPKEVPGGTILTETTYKLRDNLSFGVR